MSETNGTTVVVDDVEGVEYVDGFEGVDLWPEAEAFTAKTSEEIIAVPGTRALFPADGATIFWLLSMRYYWERIKAGYLPEDTLEKLNVGFTDTQYIPQGGDAKPKRVVHISKPTVAEVPRRVLVVEDIADTLTTWELILWSLGKIYGAALGGIQTVMHAFSMKAYTEPYPGNYGNVPVVYPNVYVNTVSVDSKIYPPYSPVTAAERLTRIALCGVPEDPRQYEQLLWQNTFAQQNGRPWSREFVLLFASASLGRGNTLEAVRYKLQYLQAFHEQVVANPEWLDTLSEPVL